MTRRRGPSQSRLTAVPRGGPTWIAVNRLWRTATVARHRGDRWGRPKISSMRSRLQTLPDRHGGRVVLGLLIVVLLIGLTFRVQAALTPPADPGNDATAYMQIAKALYTNGHYGAHGQASPND